MQVDVPSVGAPPFVIHLLSVEPGLTGHLDCSQSTPVRSALQLHCSARVVLSKTVLHVPKPICSPHISDPQYERVLNWQVHPLYLSSLPHCSALS